MKGVLKSLISKIGEIPHFLRKVDFLYTLKENILINVKSLLICSLIKNYVDKSISDPRKVVLIDLLNEGFVDTHFNTIIKNFEIISPSEITKKLRKDFIKISKYLNNFVPEKKFDLNCKFQNGLFIRNIYSYKWWDIYNDKEVVLQNHSQLNDQMKILTYPQIINKNSNLIEYIKHFITNLKLCQNDVCPICNSKLKEFGCDTCVNNFDRRVFNHQNLEIKQPDTISLFQQKRKQLLNEENTSTLSINLEKIKKFDNLSESSQTHYIFSQLDESSHNVKITLREKNGGVSEQKSKYDINNIFGRVKAKKGVVSDMIYDLSNSNVNLTVKDTSFTFDKSINVTKSVIDEEESRRIKFTNVRHNDIISAHKSIGAKIQKENKIIVGLRDNLSNESPEKI